MIFGVPCTRSSSISAGALLFDPKEIVSKFLFPFRRLRSVSDSSSLESSLELSLELSPVFSLGSFIVW